MSNPATTAAQATAMWVRTPYIHEQPLATMITPTRRLPVTETVCGQCGHDTDAHVFIATVYYEPKGYQREVPAGGHMFCPERGCACHRSWAVPVETVGRDVRPEIRPITRAQAKKLGAPLA